MLASEDEFSSVLFGSADRSLKKSFFLKYQQLFNIKKDLLATSTSRSVIALRAWKRNKIGIVLIMTFQSLQVLDIKLLN